MFDFKSWNLPHVPSEVISPSDILIHDIHRACRSYTGVGFLQLTLCLFLSVSCEQDCFGFSDEHKEQVFVDENEIPL